MTTGFVWDESYMWHDAGNLSSFSDRVQPYENYETPDTKRRLRNLLDVSGLLDHLVAVAPAMATMEELLRFHTSEYIDRIRALSADNGGDAGDGTTHVGRGSFEIAS